MSWGAVTCQADRNSKESSSSRTLELFIWKARTCHGVYYCMRDLRMGHCSFIAENHVLAFAGQKQLGLSLKLIVFAEGYRACLY